MANANTGWGFCCIPSVPDRFDQSYCSVTHPRYAFALQVRALLQKPALQDLMRRETEALQSM